MEQHQLNWIKETSTIKERNKIHLKEDKEELNEIDKKEHLLLEISNNKNLKFQIINPKQLYLEI